MSTDSAPRGSSDPRVPKAVFIIVDGIPAEVIEATHTPAIDAVSGDKGYTRSYVGGEIGAESESPTISAVGYNSLLTGTWANKHNVYGNAIEAPNYDYWDVFRIAKHANPALRTALFSTWQDNRTRLLGDSLAEAGGKKIDFAFDGLELDEETYPHDDASDYIRQIDLAVTESAVRQLAEQGPDLSWVYLQHTDDIGHRHGTGREFTEAVRLMDANVGRIAAAVRAREERFEEDWLIIVTTDHGRDAETGRHHGGQSEEERTIWIATNSDRLNARFAQRPAIVDILPSLLRHLGVDAPEHISRHFDGASFIERR